MTLARSSNIPKLLASASSAWTLLANFAFDEGFLGADLDVPAVAGCRALAGDIDPADGRRGLAVQLT